MSDKSYTEQGDYTEEEETYRFLALLAFVLLLGLEESFWFGHDVYVVRLLVDLEEV